MQYLLAIIFHCLCLQLMAKGYSSLHKQSFIWNSQLMINYSDFMMFVITLSFHDLWGWIIINLLFCIVLWRVIVIFCHTWYSTCLMACYVQLYGETSPDTSFPGLRASKIYNACPFWLFAQGFLFWKSNKFSITFLVWLPVSSSCFAQFDTGCSWHPAKNRTVAYSRRSWAETHFWEASGTDRGASCGVWNINSNGRD